MQKGKIKDIDHFALWYFNKACNYDCEYCFGHQKTEDKAVGRFSPREIAKGFNDTGRIWWIGISGGEPFLYPQLSRVVRELTKNHFIHIDTNLSCGLNGFIRDVDPERVVYINCAFHVEEVERHRTVEGFIENVLELREHGFSTIISLVTHPPVLDRLEEYYELFSSHGLTLQPKIFRGSYRKGLFRKKYPYAYTKEERRLIERNLIDPISRLALYRFPSYRGKICSAGMNFIRIYPDGSVRRCTGDPTPLGNIFNGSLRLMNRPTPCRVRYCKCLFLSRIPIVEGEADKRDEFEKIIHLNDSR